MRTSSLRAAGLVVLFTLAIALAAPMMPVSMYPPARGQVQNLPTIYPNAECLVFSPPGTAMCFVCGPGADNGCQYEMPAGFAAGGCMCCLNCAGMVCQGYSSFNCGKYVDCSNGTYVGDCYNYASTSFCK